MNTALQETPATARNTRRVVLAGNPNSGKTSLFNALTGAQARVGNYPGVTVERREGRVRGAVCETLVRDLPGTYSLVSYSPEEKIARDELLSGRYDVAVVVVDALTLRRGLVFLLQVRQLGANPVLCLNMADEARRAGQRLDLAELRRLLRLPVVETVAHRGEGLEELREAIVAAAAKPFTGFAAEIATLHAAAPAAGAGDESLLTAQHLNGVADAVLRRVIIRAPRRDTRALSDRLDRVFVHRLWGLPVFLGVMYGVFWLTFTLGAAPMGWIEAGVGMLGHAITRAWPGDPGSPLLSLLVDGIIAGVGGVVVFLPNILLLFMALSFLEDTGYLARAAFLTDRFLHRFGLHGKSFLPMLTGFGCSIPGIMATRTLENERDRLTTMLVLPLMSCGARLPIWLLVIPAFFGPAWQATALWGVYLAGIVVALGLSLLLRRTLLAGPAEPFVMELPPYRLPTAKTVALRLRERATLYLRKAGTVILALSIVLWALTSYPRPSTYRIDAEVAAGRPVNEAELVALRGAEALQHSFAGRLGTALEPVFRPLGFDWRIVTASIGAFAAKEVFVAQMGIVYALDPEADHAAGLRETLRRDYSPLVGVSLMLFLLIGTPCLATVAVTRRESGSWRWAGLQLVGLTAVAYLTAMVVYGAGRWLA